MTPTPQDWTIHQAIVAHHAATEKLLDCFPAAGYTGDDEKTAVTYEAVADTYGRLVKLMYPFAVSRQLLDDMAAGVTSGGNEVFSFRIYGVGSDGG